jgi:DoxX-like family
MNIVLWILQVVLALFFTMASLNQLFDYDKLAQQYAIYKALPQGFWVVYGVIALLCALGLVLTKVWPLATPIAAIVLAVQGVIFAGLYAHYAGFQPSFLMWSLWTLGPVIMAAFIAYARFSAIA